MVMWSQGGDHSSYGWFEDKICNCPRYKYPPLSEYGWQTELLECKVPPWCDTCKLWANRLMMCAHCNTQYYQFFNHPCMGYHPESVWRGWFCWNCLERYWPPVVWKEATTRKKVPPPLIVLPPGYELYIDD